LERLLTEVRLREHNPASAATTTAKAAAIGEASIVKPSATATTDIVACVHDNPASPPRKFGPGKHAKLMFTPPERYGTQKYSTVQTVAQCSAVQCSAVLCGAMRCCTVQCSALR
jgi:hypothetical protein